MCKSVWVFAVASLVMLEAPAGAAQPADEGASGDMAEVAQGLAQSVQGARSAVGRDEQGQAKWAGVWMDEKQVCDQGRLNPAGQRIVQAGQRYSRDHGAKLTLFTSPESAQAVRRDLAETGPEASVRANAMIGSHCYLIISK